MVESKAIGKPKMSEQKDVQRKLEEHDKRIRALEANYEISDNIASEVVLDAFSRLSYVKKISITRIPEGYSVMILHDSKDSKKVLDDMVSRKKELTTKFPSLYLDILPLEHNKVNSRQWYGAKEIYSRN